MFWIPQEEMKRSSRREEEGGGGDWLQSAGSGVMCEPNLHQQHKTLQIFSHSGGTTRKRV